MDANFKFLLRTRKVTIPIYTPISRFE